MILCREELSYEHLVVKAGSSELASKRKETARDFVKLLIKAVYHVSYSFSSLNMSEKRVSTLGFLIAFCYIRLPEFFTKVNEFLGVTFQQENQLKISQEFKKWSIDFFAYFSNECQLFKTENNRLQEEFAKDWPKIFKKSDQAFFVFSTYYFSFIRSSYPSKNCPS